MDILMTLLWAEDEPAVAHHKLQVAVSALRRSLNQHYVNDTGGGYILCKNGVYELNPLIPLRTDVDEFLEYYQAGRQSSGNIMVAYYKRACELYTGPFLSEDLYADWSFLRRKHLILVYLTMCNALAEYCLETGRYEHAMRWIGAILKENRCDEGAHRQLMRAYSALGRRSEALLQYQLCARILAEDLSVQPMPETISLFQAILNNKHLPQDRTK
jgi:DNA-binding SARP family transcriptional activator